MAVWFAFNSAWISCAILAWLSGSSFCLLFFCFHFTNYRVEKFSSFIKLQHFIFRFTSTDKKLWKKTRNVFFRWLPFFAFDSLHCTVQFHLNERNIENDKLKICICKGKRKKPTRTWTNINEREVKEREREKNWFVVKLGVRHFISLHKKR